MNLQSIVVLLQLAISLLSAAPKNIATISLVNQAMSLAEQAIAAPAATTTPAIATPATTTPTTPLMPTTLSTMVATSTATSTLSCPLYNAYHQAQFCPNQPLPSFCPATSTRQEWNQGVNAWGEGAWASKYIYVMGTMNDITDDQLVQCGMLPR